MRDIILKKVCKHSLGTDADRFVGVKFLNGKPEIYFPIGFYISESNEDIRKDISLLIKTLKIFYYKEEESLRHSFIKESQARFPLLSYQRMVLRYLNYSDYYEIENIYKKAESGKIDWGRTIKKNIPTYSQQGPVYLDYIVKKSQALNDSLISEIYKYCVYCAFEQIGWLYTPMKVRRPKIQFNKKLFITAVNKKLAQTYTDSGKELFNDMLAIIAGQSDEGFKLQDYIYGTYAFEYVWEKLVDKAFGIKDKKRYFPRSYWHIPNKIDNHVLEPDSIMINANDIYILDAKYYKYGHTGNPNHLPDTSSIHKQITYGEFIEMSDNFDFENIYNAFIMPADLKHGLLSCQSNMVSIGYATSDWKKDNKTYEKITGVLVDTKYLMMNYMHNSQIIDELCNAII